MRIPFQYNESHPQPPTGATGAPVKATRPPANETPPSEPETRSSENTTRPAGKERRTPEPPERPPLDVYLTRFLRGTAVLDLAAGTWLRLVDTGRAPCGTRLCEVATLNGHEHVAGLVALIAAAVLILALPLTAGLTRASIVTATALGGVAVIGLGAVTGVVMVAVLLLSVVVVTLAAVLGVMMGAIRGELTR
ncbi:hypothetical protein JCM9957A_37050 [Kineosporia succinea]